MHAPAVVLPLIPNARDRLAIRRSFYPEYPERRLWTGTTMCIDEETFDDLIEILERLVLGDMQSSTAVTVHVRRRHRSWDASPVEDRASNLLLREFSNNKKNIEIHFPRERDDWGLNYVRLSHSDSGSCEAHGHLLRALVPTKVSGMLLNVDDVAFAISHDIVLDECWVVVECFIPILVRSIDVIDGRIVRMRYPLNPDVTPAFVRDNIESSGVVPSVVESYVIDRDDDYFGDSSVLHVVFAAEASASLDPFTLLTVWAT